MIIKQIGLKNSQFGLHHVRNESVREQSLVHCSLPLQTGPPAPSAPHRLVLRTPPALPEGQTLLLLAPEQ